MKRQSIAWGVLLAGLCGGGLTAACGGREAHWDAPAETAVSYGLDGSVAIPDAGLDRVLMVTSPAEHQLEVAPLPVGKNVVAITTSVDKRRLFVLSKGEQPRYRPDDERPQLLVIDGTSSPEITERFELDDPLTKLAIDPQGDWVAAYEADSTVMNPNEIVLFALEGNSVVQSKTIRSFGGFPLELVFTDPLTLPSGRTKRFLVVRTDRDITLVDLSDLKSSEKTVKLPEVEKDKTSVPAQIVYDDGDPDNPNDARLAVRLVDQSDVVILDLAPASDDRDFMITPNIVDVGGVPSAIDFVRTGRDGKDLRLAALVPGRLRATLVDPASTATETVNFPVPYSRMTRITDSVNGAPEEGDVALLWSEDARGIAFWSLGQASSTPFRSVDANDIDVAVSRVIDVPAPNRHIKLLASAGADRFFVLDLEKRQTFPMLTRGSGFRVNVAPDGKRLWAFLPNHGELSSIDLSDLHPTALSVRERISQVHDVKRGDGGRAALVLHGSDNAASTNLSVTLLDALRPDSADSRFFGGLYLEGLR